METACDSGRVSRESLRTAFGSSEEKGRVTAVLLCFNSGKKTHQFVQPVNLFSYRRMGKKLSKKTYNNRHPRFDILSEMRTCDLGAEGKSTACKGGKSDPRVLSKRDGGKRGAAGLRVAPRRPTSVGIVEERVLGRRLLGAEAGSG